MTKRNKRILVVDDEIDICNFLKSFFEVRGFDVETARNGDEAMSKLLLVEPDLVILDIIMRERDEGLKYLPKIKKALPSTKVIMVTAVEDDEAVAIASGRDWAGQETCDPGPVWIFNNEDDGDEMQRRLYAILDHMDVNIAAVKGKLFMNAVGLSASGVSWIS